MTQVASHFIAGNWVAGGGEAMQSTNPVTGAVLWRGVSATQDDVESAVRAANVAYGTWSLLGFADRLHYVEAFRAVVEAKRDELSRIIAAETGKPLWDCAGEAGAVIAKIAISVAAYHDRTGESSEDKGEFRQELGHRPLGVMAVFGPYNFPAHLPNGHMIPALLAGNTVVVKPSEETPHVAEFLVKCWEEAGVPEGVVNLLQGGRDTGVSLVNNREISGVLFTGSPETGRAIHKALAGRPEVMLALEMGGNNPLIVHDVKDVDAAATVTVQSAYITSGQRCTCARRLIVPEGAEGDAFVDALVKRIGDIRIGAPEADPVPFMGPVINMATANNLLHAQEILLESGAIALVKMEKVGDGYQPFVTPALIDVTALVGRDDAEYFGPLLQLIRVKDVDAAIEEANNTAFGLSAGLLSDNAQLWQHFRTHIRAGVVNWNRPLTGAASAMPFGGPGLSGNLRPSAYYAADYCAYPMASLASDELVAPASVVGLE